MLPEPNTKEILGGAFIRAIAGMARVNLGFDEYDCGVDGTFKRIIKSKNGIVPSGFPIDYQLKSTTKWKIENNHVVYNLEVKNYNDMVLRNNGGASSPLILILLCLPRDKQSWLTINEDMLTMKKCCYWHLIKNDESDNTSTVTIKIPTTNVFDPETLKNLMSKVERGDLND